MSKVAILIDGWFMRKRIIETNAFWYEGKSIREYCLKHLRAQDDLYRIFYYDTPPLALTVEHPITGNQIDFGNTLVARDQNELFRSLKRTSNMALRLGKTVWMNSNWVLSPEKTRALLRKEITVNDLLPGDVHPQIQQKAVDMKIGLDMASLALKKLVDRVVIISGDSDLVPAIKLARTEGLVVGLDPLLSSIADDLAEHIDYVSTYIEFPGGKSQKDLKA